jgi:hypothetical protein
MLTNSAKVLNGDSSRLIYQGDTDPIEWFKIFELQAAMLEWEDEEKHKFIGAFLDSKAKRVWEEADATDKSDYVAVKKLLIDKCKKNADTLLSTFLASKKTANESLPKYARRLQEILLKALPTISVDERTCLLRSQLCHEVPSNMKALIQFSSSFGDGNWDKILDMLDKTLPANGLSNLDIIKSTTEFDVHNTIMNQNRGQNNGSRQQQQTCFTCGKPGHRAAQCRRGNSNNNNYPVQNVSGAPNQNYNNKFGGSYGQPNIRPAYRPPSHQNMVQNRSQPRGGFGYQQPFRSMMQANNAEVNQQQQYHNEYQFQASNYNNNNSNVNSGTTQLNDFPFHQQLNSYQSQSESESQQNDNYNIYGQVLELEVSAALLRFNVGDSKTLLKINIVFTLFGIEHEIKAIALIDGGSSHSFISPNLLTAAHQKILMCPDTMWVKRQMHRINGVIAGADSFCSIVNSDLSLKSDDGEQFTCEQEFVISAQVRNHDMILGRNWLYDNDVTIRHGRNQMEIGNSENLVLNFLNYNQNSERKETSSSSDSNNFCSKTDAKDEISKLSSMIENLKIELNKRNPKHESLIDNSTEDLLDLSEIKKTL